MHFKCCIVQLKCFITYHEHDMFKHVGIYVAIEEIFIIQKSNATLQIENNSIMIQYLKYMYFILHTHADT